ncbi:hypothetical protein EVG20_g4367 [Dentipellis fragilis]|uniref:MYND-type domain-containing protein n=1 Tax=Dentipellis fragilis TaxID=205917 RepID=A0A4Y9YVV8_9AGAM|nr:hypothetical protein EVG20_g4367 [Dentipellis fragilis]
MADKKNATGDTKAPSTTRSDGTMVVNSLSGIVEPFCTHCRRQPGKQHLRRCTRCNYCSKECQKENWESHKSECWRVVELAHELSDNPAASRWNAELNRWVMTWKSTLFLWSIVAMDLPNKPPDYLSTHFMWITLVQRPDPPRRQQLFRLHWAANATNDGFAETMRDIDEDHQKKLDKWAQTCQATPKDSIRVIITFLPTTVKMASNEMRFVFSPYSAYQVGRGLDGNVIGEPKHAMAYLQQLIERGEPTRFH